MTAQDVIAFASSHSGEIAGIVALVLAKAVSTEKRVPIVTQIQKVMDLAAKGLQAAADILAEVIKSDGVLGKK